MPEPIQSSASVNQSYYDPSEQLSCAPDPGSPATSPASSPATVADGKAELLKKYGSGGEDCTKYLFKAGVSLAVAGTSAVVGIATAPSGLGAVSGLVGTIGGVAKGAEELVGYFNCEDKNERLDAYADDCHARGGTLLAGAGDSTAVCVALEQ